MSIAWLVLALLAPAEAKKPRRPPEAPAPASAAFTLPCTYAPGAVRTYRAESTTTDRKAGVPDDAVVTRTDYTITVGSWDGSVVVAEITSGVAEIVDPPGDPLMAQILGQAAGIRLEKPARVSYTHAVGQAQLVNVEEMVAEFAAAGARARPLVEASLGSLPPESAAGILGWYDAYVSNPVVVSKPFVELGQPLFAYTCATLEPGAYPYQAGLPNAFGPEPLPAKGTLGVGAPQGDRVHFVDTVLLDPIGAMAILGPIFASMGIEVPEGAGLEALAIDVSSRLDLDVSLADGWPAGWTSVQDLRAGDTQKVIRTVVTRVE